MVLSEKTIPRIAELRWPAIKNYWKLLCNWNSFLLVLFSWLSIQCIIGNNLGVWSNQLKIIKKMVVNKNRRDHLFKNTILKVFHIWRFFFNTSFRRTWRCTQTSSDRKWGHFGFCSRNPTFFKAGNTRIEVDSFFSKCWFDGKMLIFP